jgi:hypothetical protein
MQLLLKELRREIDAYPVCEKYDWIYHYLRYMLAAVDT